MWLARQPQQRACGGHLFPSLRRLLLASLRLFSASAGRRGAPPPPEKPTHFMVDYLRNSCGFSAVEAQNASKHFAHLKSPERPDAVLRLLRQEGWGDADIRRAVQRVPRLFLADAKRTVEPKIGALRGAGFSGPEVAELISTNPKFLAFRDVARRVEFWRELVGTNRHVLKTMKRNPRAMCYNVDSRLVPGLSLLRSLGVPDGKMAALARRRPSLVSGNPDRIRDRVKQVKGMGIPPGTAMFAEALCSVDCISRSALDAKSQLLRNFGWTQAELISAIQRFPVILRYSQQKLNTVLDFLLNEAGCEPSYIARNPTLVGYSIEKRLSPRLYILQCLKAKGLPAGKKDLSSAMSMNQDSFVHKYIIPYSGQLPELLEAYHAACVKNAKANTGSL